MPVVTATTTTRTATSSSGSATAALASIDLKGYDAEQARLMDERCIVVDEQDRPIGALDKKTCKLLLLLSSLRLLLRYPYYTTTHSDLA